MTNAGDGGSPVEPPTLLVMTKGRSDLLQRQADFLRAFPGQTLIVDASDHRAAPIGDHPRLRYLHRPGMPFWQRTAFALAEVTTAACALCADDDYFDFGFLQAAAEHLAASPGTVRVFGITVGFEQLVPWRLDIDTACMPTCCSASDTSAEHRFHGFFAAFRPQTFYGVTRTTTARLLLNLLAPTPDEGFQLAETMWYAAPFLFGRIDHLSRLMNVRSVEAHMPDYRWTYSGFRTADPARAAWVADIEDRIATLAAAGALDAAGVRLLRAGMTTTFARLHNVAVTSCFGPSPWSRLRRRLSHALGRRGGRSTKLDPSLRDASLTVLRAAGWGVEARSTESRYAT